MSDSANETKKLIKYKVRDIPHDSYFSEPVYLEKNFVLAAPEMPFSESLIRTLGDWEFEDVYSAGIVAVAHPNRHKSNLFQHRTFSRLLRKIQL